MKSLSFRQASSCENAKHKGCRCRCGGGAHGITRGEVDDLPEDDPHYIDPDRATKARQRKETRDAVRA